MKRTYTQADVTDTVISQDIQLKGDISSDNDIWIDGQVEGDIGSSGNVTIGVNGRINGNIQAVEVRIAGSVIGDITAINGIVCSDSSQVSGTLRARDLEVARGAVISGTVDMPIGPVEADEEE